MYITLAPDLQLKKSRGLHERNEHSEAHAQSLQLLTTGVNAIKLITAINRYSHRSFFRHRAVHMLKIRVVPKFMTIN